MQPVTALQWQLGRGGAIAGTFLILICMLVWTGTVSVLDSSPKSRMTRLLRRWAGLPTTTAGGLSTTVGAASGSVNLSGGSFHRGLVVPPVTRTLAQYPKSSTPLDGSDEPKQE